MTDRQTDGQCQLAVHARHTGNELRDFDTILLYNVEYFTMLKITKPEECADKT